MKLKTIICSNSDEYLEYNGIEYWRYIIFDSLKWLKKNNGRWVYLSVDEEIEMEKLYKQMKRQQKLERICGNFQK